MADLEDPNAIPSLYTCFSNIYHSLSNYIGNAEEGTLNLSEFWKDMMRYGEVSWVEGVAVVIMALFLTMVRHVLSSICQHFGKYCQMSPTNLQKLPESCWKAMMTTCMWSFSFYMLIISGRHDYFHKPNFIWNDWQPGSVLPLDVWLYYVLQFGFYLHSLYGTIFLDRWRKDSYVMIFHHLLTMTLLVSSYATRYHKIGMMVLFVHDCADVFLEFTKCNVYLKNRGGKFYPIHDHLATFGFLMFALVWFVGRLYLFPVKLLYSASYGVIKYGPKPMMPFYLYYNIMLLLLLCLNLYWFLFILNLIFKVLTGQMKEVDDIREDEVMDSTEKKQAEKLANSQQPQINGSNKNTGTENGVRKRVN